MKMNLPNKLTILRVIMVPFFVAFLLLTPSHTDFKWIAFALFVVASLSDGTWFYPCMDDGCDHQS